MTWHNELSPAELRAIFKSLIADTLRTAERQQEAALIFVGAQPGAGKTQAISRARAERPDAVAVIGDDFRQYHPDYRALMIADPLSMPDVTAQAAGQWIEMAVEHLRGERRSVILETTMRQQAVVENTAAAFRSQGYRIEVHALAVPGAISALGTVTRYLGTADRTEQNRWTPSTAHEAAYAAMPTTVEKLVASGIVDRVTIFTRDQRTLHDATVTSANAQASGIQARQAIEGGRRVAGMTSEQGAAWVNDYVAASIRLAEIPTVAADLRATMDRLATIAPEIVRRTHEPAARTAALDRIAAAESPGRSSTVDARRGHAQWWGIDLDKASPRTPHQGAERSAHDTAATRIARDIAKLRDHGRGLDR